MTTINLGPTSPGLTIDDGNGGLLCATKYLLAQQATLQSLSFYVETPSGQLNLGVFSDNNGTPGMLVAETGPFVTGVGWNTKTTTIHPLLQPGSYWLAYLAQNNALAFRKTSTGGTSRVRAVTFGSLPAYFPSPLGISASIWSQNATLATVPPPPPPPPPPTTVTVTVLSPFAAAVSAAGVPAKLTVSATAYDASGNVLANQIASSGTVTPPPPRGLPPGVTLQAIDGESML